MLNLPLDEIKLIAKSRCIKDHKNKSEDELMKILSEPKPKINFSKPRIEKIRKKFNKLRDRLSKSRTKKIRRNLYEIESEKNRFTPKIKEIEKNIFALGINLFKPKEYYDYDDAKYKRIRDVRNLFYPSIDEDHYYPVKTVSAFNSIYTEYESIGDKDKTLIIKEYIDMIRPYLTDMINNHKLKVNGKLN